MEYKWTVLTNTTLGGLMASINMTIVLISLPTIFRGLSIDPTASGEFTILLWVLMGYSIVLATLLVTFGRLSDIFGRTRLYTLGFLIFTAGSVMLSIIPDGSGNAGAYTLIGFRMFQAVGGGLLMVNTTALITDAFSSDERGKALGINQVAFIAGSLIGLVLGGILASYNWHFVFLVNIPFAVAGSIWSVVKLKETTERIKVPLDYAGNILLGGGLIIISLGFTYTLVPYSTFAMGWNNPWVIIAFVTGIAMIFLFIFVERSVKSPMFDISLFKIKPFAFGNLAGMLASLGRGAVMFLTIIWLQGIYLPLNNYPYSVTPFWAGIYMLPMMGGFVILGPIGGMLTDRYGARVFSTAGMIITAISLYLLTTMPADFSNRLWEFEGILLLNGIGMGLFAAPNTTSIMNSLPPKSRGAGSGMRFTMQNIGQTISMAVFFSITITVFSQDLPSSMYNLGIHLGLPAQLSSLISEIPPSGALFAAFLGINPISALPSSALAGLPPGIVSTITSNTFFPNAISSSFMLGLRSALYIAIALTILGAVFSALRGKRYVHGETPETGTADRKVASGHGNQDIRAKPKTNKRRGGAE